MLRRAYESGFLEHPIQQGAPLPVLQYADDTLLIMKGSTQQAESVKMILDTFAAFSGLRINYQKSTLVSLNLTAETAHSIAATIGCSLATLPSTYLGLPLSMNKINRQMLQPVI